MVVTVQHPKPTILIVEDEEGPRNALRIILRPFFELAITSSRQEALQALLAQPIDLVTLDLKLPDGHGLDLFHAIKRARRGVEIVIITGYGTLRSSQESVRHGAAGYLLKPFNVAELIALINRTLERKHRLDDIRGFLRSAPNLWADERSAADAWAQLRDRFPVLPSMHPVPPFPGPCDAGDFPLIADLLEASDHMLLPHANRVRSYAALLAAPLNLSSDDQHALAIGAFLHDIGYVALNRWDAGAQETGGGSDRADDLHPMLGVRMTAPLGIPELASHIIAHHHERYDGAGHPNGLAGNQIPLLARIVCVAQTFDHLTAQTGQPPLPFDEACERLGNQAGTALDPALVELFLERIGESPSAHAAQAHA
ncbi:MAG: HD domain-containing phosphohydrolase [Nitrospirota bacterium]